MSSKPPSPTAHPVVSQMKKNRGPERGSDLSGTHSRSASESEQDLKSTSYPKPLPHGFPAFGISPEKVSGFFCHIEERTQQREGFPLFLFAQ